MTRLFLFVLTLLYFGTVAFTSSVKHEHTQQKVRNSGLPRLMSYHITQGITLTKPSLFQRVKRAVTGEDDKPITERLIVSSNIMSRYSTTVVESMMYNPATTDGEATFSILLPDTAFMSNFTMLIDEKLYIAEVKSKEEADELYERAKEENKTVGKVESDPNFEPQERIRGMDKFKVAVNIAAESRIRFTLTYLDLLVRRFGQYEHRVSIRPNQIVEDLQVNAMIYEPQGIVDFILIEPLDTNSLGHQDTLVNMNSTTTYEVFYKPDAARQAEMGEKGLTGEFVIGYDVAHDYDAGLVQVEDGYFVHFFSPSTNELSPLNKNIIFVVDIGGSMGSDEKDVQARDSMLYVLDQLREGDNFMILLFDNQQDIWPSKRELVPATSSNIDSAKSYCRNQINAQGGTNINDALVSASEYLNNVEQYGANMIVFLTDGDPTSGETDHKKNLNNVVEATGGKVPIFSLGFGFDLDYDLLKSISYRTKGLARRIYTGVDAELQLKKFFEELNNPMLYDIKMNYPLEFIEGVTQTEFAQYFEGSELVVAGKFNDSQPAEWDMRVVAMSVQQIDLPKHIISNDTIQVPPESQKVYSPGFLQRLYIYMKIKDQLRRILMTDDEEEIEQVREFALQMALEYHLVTPFTSFIFTENLQPEEEPMQMEDSRMASYLATGTALGSGSCIGAEPGYTWVMAGMLTVILGVSSDGVSFGQ